MKFSTFASALAIGAAVALSPVVSYAQAKDGKEQKFHKMDTNKDGMVSKDEFMKAMTDKWNEMDKGKKGMLSAADIDKIISSFNP